MEDPQVALQQMLARIRDSRTRRIFLGETPSGFPQDVVSRARECVWDVVAASILEDVNAWPGRRLEALRGDRRGQHSIRINRQWRVCFVWTELGATEIEVVDYH